MESSFIIESLNDVPEYWSLARPSECSRVTGVVDGRYSNQDTLRSVLRYAAAIEEAGYVRGSDLRHTNDADLRTPHKRSCTP